MNIQLSTIHQKRRHLSSHLFHLSSRTTTTRARARDFGTVGTHFVGSYSSAHGLGLSAHCPAESEKISTLLDDYCLAWNWVHQQPSLPASGPLFLGHGRPPTDTGRPDGPGPGPSHSGFGFTAVPRVRIFSGVWMDQTWTVCSCPRHQQRQNKVSPCQKQCSTTCSRPHFCERGVEPDQLEMCSVTNKKIRIKTEPHHTSAPDATPVLLI